MGNKTKAWPLITPGDSIDLVAPAFKTLPGQIQPTKSYLKKWDLEPIFKKQTFEKHYLMANSDGKRLKLLKSALLNSKSAGVWSLRGGYGSIRLLPELLKLKKPRTAKMFMGLSDITSLLIFLNQKWNWNVLHGPNLVKVGTSGIPQSDIDYLRKVLFGEVKLIEFPRLKALNRVAKRKGQVSGSIIGGNLITLQSTLGTPFEIDTSNKFLFIEDIGERGYKVDRVLEHLKQAGKFKRVKGVLIGQFTGGKEPSGRDLVPSVLKNFADSVSFPVVSGFQSGHGPRQRPIPFGPKAKLLLGTKCRLEVPSGGQ